jgi:hypothetical protein
LDKDLEPAFRDASFYAECVAGGGPYWWEGSDAQRRLAYWESWLEVAVARAWALDWDFRWW